MKYKLLLNWEVATFILTEPQAYHMAVFLENNIAPEEDKGKVIAICIYHS